jgi:hypothetical protein
MIEFHLDPGSGVAPYLQLIHQVRNALRLGVLRGAEGFAAGHQHSGVPELTLHTLLSRIFCNTLSAGISAGSRGCGRLRCPGRG